MTGPLPDVDEVGYDEYHQQLFSEDVDRKIHGLTLSQQVNDRVADLNRIGGWAASEYQQPAPQPEPQPVAEPAPPEALPSPEPAAAPAAVPTQPASPSPPPAPAGAVSAPADTTSDWENQVFGQALGAISQVGGDVQSFADQFGSGLRGAADVQSVYGQALGAAAAAGADVQGFADRFQPPEKPVESVTARPPAGGGPQPGGPLQDYARQAAIRDGLDPDIFQRQIQQESGFNPNALSPAGASGVAQIVPKYHPSVDTSDPYASLDYAANLMKSNLARYGGDYAKALAAYNAGAGAVERYGGVPPFEETQRYVNTILGGGPPPARPTTAAEQALGQTGGWAAQAERGRDISQFGDPQLTNDEAYAACGPAAAVRFAQRYGRNPSLREATDLARTVGWSSSQGMAGLSSEKALMDKLGVPTKLVSGADWGTFANEARTGNPVTISTQGHYFTADGWDPQTNRFHVGRSGLDLKGGSEWMTPEQMTAVMGPVQGGLLADNPQVASPSVADQDTNPASWLGRAKDSMVSSLTGDDSILQRGIIGPLKGALSLDTTPDVHDFDMKIASVGESRPLDPFGGDMRGVQGAAQQPIPSDVLTNPLGTGNAPQDSARLTGQLAGDIAPAQPTIFQDPTRIPGVQGAGDILGAIGELPGLSEADRAGRREAVANAPVLGGALGMARGPLLVSDQELVQHATPEAMDAARQLARTSRLATGGGEPTETDVAIALRDMRIGESLAIAQPAGEAAGKAAAAGLKTGSGMLTSALGQLRGYPEELAGPIRAWAESADAPASSVALTIQRWIEQNPRAAARAQVLAPTTTTTPNLAARVVEELNATLRSAPRGGATSATGATETGGAGLARGDVYRPRGIGDLLDTGAEGVPLEGAGVNLPNYVPDGVRRVVGRGWDEAGPAAQAARTGTIEPGVLEDLASAAKTTVDRARSVLRLDDPANSKTAYVLRQAFDDQASRVRQAQLALRDAPDDLNATRDLVRELAGHRALQETVAGLEPKAGRSLDQFRFDETLGDMAKRFKMLPDEFVGHLRDNLDTGDPANIADFAKKAYGYTFKDKALAVWYFNLLSNPLTHIRNGVANTTSALTAPIEGAVASGFDPLARKMLGNTGPRQRYIQEFPAEYVGMINSVTDGARQGMRRMVTGISDRAAGGSELRAGERVGESSGLGGPISEALGGGLKNPINIPGRALAASDDFYRTVNEGASIHGLANRIARQEGHTGEALTDRIAELIKRPTEEMLDQASETGAYRVFQQANKWAEKVNQIRGDSVAGRFLLPFTKTPLNLMGYALERSPVGIASILNDFRTTAGRAALREKGAGDLSDRMSRAAIGSTVWTALAKQAFDGNLTGNMPRDPTERDAFRREGKQPYSFRNPTDGSWVSYLPLSPYSTMFGAAASVADAWKKGQIENPDDISKLGLGVGAAFAEGMLDTQWTEQFADALDIVNGGSADPVDAITKFATRQAGNVNPGILRWFARATDDVLRDPQNPIQGVLAGNPFTQGMVNAQLNAWGEPLRRPISGAEALVNPFNPSAETTDKVELELKRLSENKAYGVEPGLVGGTASVLGQDTKMTEAQQRHYQQMSGYLSKTLLDILVGSDQYESASDPEKAKMINSVYEKTRSSVRESMQPDMIEQAIQARVREARTQAGVAKPTATPAEEATSTPAGPRSGGGVIRGGGPVRTSGSPVPQP